MLLKIVFLIKSATLNLMHDVAHEHPFLVSLLRSMSSKQVCVSSVFKKMIHISSHTSLKKQKQKQLLQRLVDSHYIQQYPVNKSWMQLVQNKQSMGEQTYLTSPQKPHKEKLSGENYFKHGEKKLPNWNLVSCNLSF